MNTPIINPLWIYLIDIANELDLLSMLAVGICVVMVLVSIGMVSEGYKDYLKLGKKALVFGVISLIVLIFTPSEDTMYKMLVTSYITPQNIEVTGETITDTVDYIFEKVEQLQEEE
jgi:uncharacterized membrane protein